MELNPEQHLQESRPQSGTDKQAEIMERLSKRRRQGQLVEAALLAVAFLLFLVLVWPGALLKKPIRKAICDSDPANPICSPAFRENT